MDPKEEPDEQDFEPVLWDGYELDEEDAEVKEEDEPEDQVVEEPTELAAAKAVQTKQEDSSVAEAEAKAEQDVDAEAEVGPTKIEEEEVATGAEAKAEQDVDAEAEVGQTKLEGDDPSTENAEDDGEDSIDDAEVLKALQPKVERSEQKGGSGEEEGMKKEEELEDSIPAGDSEAGSAPTEMEEEDENAESEVDATQDRPDGEEGPQQKFQYPREQGSSKGQKRKTPPAKGSIAKEFDDGKSKVPRRRRLRQQHSKGSGKGGGKGNSKGSGKQSGKASNKGSPKNRATTSTKGQGKKGSGKGKQQSKSPKTPSPKPPPQLSPTEAPISPNLRFDGKGWSWAPDAPCQHLPLPPLPAAAMSSMATRPPPPPPPVAPASPAAVPMATASASVPQPRGIWRSDGVFVTPRPAVPHLVPARRPPRSFPAPQ